MWQRKVCDMERLYLDGQEVDVSGEGITFTMKSNLLGEFGKIVAGSSQTVKLPRTVRNMAVLDFPELASRTGAKVRRRMSARLERNGVMMIDDGEAVILSTREDGYEIGITYGVVSFLSAVKEGGNLDELAEETEYIDWNNSSLITFPMVTTDIDGNVVQELNYGYARYDNGVNDEDVVNVHPCVRLTWLVTKIEERFGFKFAGFGDGLRDMCMLLTEKRQSVAAIEAMQGEYVCNEMVSVEVLGRWYSFLKMTRAVSPNYKIDYGSTAIKVGQSLNRMSIAVSVGGYPEVSTMYLLRNMSYPFQGDAVASAKADDYGDYSLVAEIEDVREGDNFRIVFDGQAPLSGIIGGVQISASYKWAEGQEPEEMSYPSGIYPVVKNLPAMKVTEFIQMCGALTGRFPMVNKGEKGVLRMVSVEDLTGAKWNAVDWSEKWDGDPDEVEYTYLDAMKNYIRWKADEDVEKSGAPTDGYVSVDDDTLEVWNDLIKLPLSASNGGRIPQYSVVDGKLEEMSISERILMLDRTSNEVAYTERLWPQELAGRVFRGYQELVRRPIKIKGTFRLTELDIRELDYMRPVYLRQTGRYYGIVQVQYKGNESVVELLQLPTAEI